VTIPDYSIPFQRRATFIVQSVDTAAVVDCLPEATAGENREVTVPVEMAEARPVENRWCMADSKS
jgi:hypothetical protein